MRNLILVTIFSIAIVIKGCYGDDIDSLNQRVKSLTTENALLKSTIDLNNTNTATSISDLKTSLAALEVSLTKSIENLNAIQQSITTSQTDLISNIKIINSTISSISSSITTVSNNIIELDNSLSSSITILNTSVSTINSDISSLESSLGSVNNSVEELNQLANPLYLHSNGVTIIVGSRAVIGGIYPLNGLSYMVVDNSTIANYKDRDIATTRVSDMSGLFNDENTFNRDISH